MRVSNGLQLSVGLIGVALYIGATSYAAYHGYGFYRAHDRHMRNSEIEDRPTLAAISPTFAPQHSAYADAKTMLIRNMFISCVTFGLGILCTLTARRIQSERWPFTIHESAEDSSVRE